jgi:phosphomevalonate kinase
VIARAPGKLVISGAYAVLSGAPAIVSAVDRYVIADTSRQAELSTPELSAALGDRPAPFFDAAALFKDGRKLGLGSSAAILVASLAALELDARAPLTDSELCASVLGRALTAHALAQRGGSGVDVAASSHGGTLVVRREEGTLTVQRAELPPGLNLAVWASGVPVSSQKMLELVQGLSERDPAAHQAALAPQSRAAERAAAALERRDASALVETIATQHEALYRLGSAAGAPIITDAVRELHRLACRERACVIPSGAGGGDIALYVGLQAPSSALRKRAEALGHEWLDLKLGARGVHAADGPD